MGRYMSMSLCKEMNSCRLLIQETFKAWLFPAPQAYGGFVSSLLLLSHSSLFKCGVAVAPITNWRLYGEIIYTYRINLELFQAHTHYLRMSVKPRKAKRQWSSINVWWVQTLSLKLSFWRVGRRWEILRFPSERGAQIPSMTWCQFVLAGNPPGLSLITSVYWSSRVKGWFGQNEPSLWPFRAKH